MAGAALAAAVPARRSHAAPAPGRVLFAQGSLAGGIGPNFSVTGVKPAYNPVGQFYLHANQPNPYTRDGDFLPVTWDAGRMTGLHVPPDRRAYQRGIWLPSQDSGRERTIAQIRGDVVGAYLNSSDLIHLSPGKRMMIAAGYQFPRGPACFADPSSLMGVSLDLQVPSASNEPSRGVSNAYVKIDILFTCARGGARLSYSCGLFVNNGYPTHDNIGFDNLTNTVIVAAQVSPVGHQVTRLPGSGSLLSTPWTGWQTFAFTISQKQFARGLADAAPVARSFGNHLSLDPATWYLASTHLNAEIHYERDAPATLGWSMRRLQLTQVA